MSVMYFLLCYMFITISPFYAAKVVDISYTSQGSPDFYLNDEVTFTCAATGLSGVRNLVLVFYDDRITTDTGCHYNAADDKWGLREGSFIGSVNGFDSPQLTPAYCESVGKAEGFSISIKVAITDVTRRATFYCRAYDRIESTSSREVFVTSVKVAPENIIMSVPEDVVEGEEFEVKCESTGAGPVSSYKYEIRTGSTAVATAGTYTSTESDRGGITLTCTDTAHPNWRGGNTVISKKILPKYIDIVAESNIYVEFNPQYSTSELHCASYITGNPVPDTFRWVWNGWLRESSGTLTLIPRDNVVEETVKCTAENGIGKNVTVTWNIRWKSDVTTTPTTTPKDTTATSNKPPVAAIVGGVVGGAAILIIIIIISVYCWRNIKDQRKRQAPVDAVTSDHTELTYKRDIHEYAEILPQLPAFRINDAVQNPSSPNHTIIPPVTEARKQNYVHANVNSQDLNVSDPYFGDHEEAYEQPSSAVPDDEILSNNIRPNVFYVEIIQ